MSPKIKMNKNKLAMLALSLATCGSTPISCKSGEISVVTYNVHGLPEDIAGSSPEENMPQIGEKLNPYNIALIQEDWYYHPLLSSAVKHKYQTPAEFYLQRNEEIIDPSGLSLFSQFPIKNYTLRRWLDCNGTIDQANDCLAPKGVAVAEIEAIPGVWIDVYNCHMDAGDSAGDIDARNQQIKELASFIKIRSPSRAVIVGCDTNMKQVDEMQLEQLLFSTGLKDSCQELDCPEPYMIDRILYRSGSAVQLEPMSWYIPGNFVNNKEKDLSDHKPVVVEFSVTVGMSDLK